MRLIVTDQIKVTAIRKELLRPGEHIDAAPALAEELLQRHPRCFARDITALPSAPETQALDSGQAKPRRVRKDRPAATQGD